MLVKVKISEVCVLEKGVFENEVEKFEESICDFVGVRIFYVRWIVILLFIDKCNFIYWIESMCDIFYK